MKAFFSILFICISGIIFAQSEDLKIRWSEENKLTWEDFLGIPIDRTLFQANTSTGLSYSWGLKGTSEKRELVYKVETYFYPEQSWVQPTTKSKYLLQHEQLHFNISELHARKLRKMLSDVNSSKLNKDSKIYLNKHIEQIDKNRSDMQNAFDSETNHSLNTLAELRWQAYIKSELQKFIQYIN